MKLIQTSNKRYQIRLYFFRYFRLFILCCGISRTSFDRMSNFSRRARLCEVRSAMVRIHSFRRYFDAWGREREGGEQKVERNPIISLVGCHVGAAVTRQVFSFITYESEAFFLPVRPWDQTGFHRRSAVTEYTPIPKSSSPSRDVFFFFGPERRVFFPIDLWNPF